jgi:hypothetical protein
MHGYKGVEKNTCTSARQNSAIAAVIDSEIDNLSETFHYLAGL